MYHLTWAEIVEMPKGQLDEYLHQFADIHRAMTPGLALPDLKRR